MGKLAYTGNCRKGSAVLGERFRITILTSRLIRLEYSEEGYFEDRPSQFAVNRYFPQADFTVYDREENIEIHTDSLSLYYNKEVFSPGGLTIRVTSPCRGIYSTWHYGDPLDENLGGTTRTLDQVDGAIPLEKGIQSRLQGYSVIDDSHSVLLDGEWFAPRNHEGIDLYFFGYGYAYQDALNDYFKLSGNTPLLPRYALGNWWSRFYKYDEDSYNLLMDHFKAEKIPLSVAVIDMDWHITEVDPRIGKGWTGFSWNRKLFPDPKGFLTSLHERKLRVTLNLHPAEGIQAHEDNYSKAVLSMLRTDHTSEAIPFDFCNPRFVRTYFDVMLKPLEEDGTDFWWIDWQQGTQSKKSGADPLWLLNHFHFMENGNEKRRPMIFSRYAGPGSHRYPVGFSGDTIISWASLQFQPYFTSTAANIGYGWWSHDIGGHCAGVHDEELMVRWVQLGVFSPIMRLHSTCNLFNGKEPWRYREPFCSIIKSFLCLRHQLIPYLYSMNWKCNQDGVMLVRPLYYQYPEAEEAYENPTEFLFGSELIVSPAVTPLDAITKCSKTKVWLPEGVFYDFFSGVQYSGNRTFCTYRSLELLPVFAHAGAIVPMTGKEEATQNGADNPVCMEIRVFTGASGHFQLYEDDGISEAYNRGESCFTDFVLYDSGHGEFRFQIKSSADKWHIRPEGRNYSIKFYGVGKPEEVTLSGRENAGDLDYRYDLQNDSMCITITPDDCFSDIEITVRYEKTVKEHCAQNRIYEALNKMHLPYELKDRVFRCTNKNLPAEEKINELMSMDLTPDAVGVITEILCSES